jgi:cobyrinic acid a,c-diamide synthase
MTANPAGLVIAAARSGSGKSTLTMGLLRALTKRAMKVQPFKCGPDYIDPAFHQAASGRTSINLDAWGMRPGLIERIVSDAGADADLCLVEGVMGLFDGARAPGHFGRGSTADLAALLGWPVLLVLDVAAQAETAAAIALGLHRYREDVRIAGVILNNVGGPSHVESVSQAVEAVGIPVLGAVPRTPRAALGERHLGLVQAAETADLDDRIEAIAEVVARGVDLDRLASLARPMRLAQPAQLPVSRLPPPGQRTAVAQDAAFSFTYPHILDGWRNAGAEIVSFSPLADEAPRVDSDAIWLPGGYPELHAAQLAQAANFKAGMHAAVERGARVHGECGGYMVLGTGLEDAEGRRHAMLGLLGLDTTFAARRLHLGYRRARVLAQPHLQLLGHEFHYCSVTANPDAPYAEIFDATGTPTDDQGARRGNITGTFFHVIDMA